MVRAFVDPERDLVAVRAVVATREFVRAVTNGVALRDVAVARGATLFIVVRCATFFVALRGSGAGIALRTFVAFEREFVAVFDFWD